MIKLMIKLLFASDAGIIFLIILLLSTLHTNLGCTNDPEHPHRSDRIIECKMSSLPVGYSPTQSISTWRIRRAPTPRGSPPALEGACLCSGGSSALIPKTPNGMQNFESVLRTFAEGVVQINASSEGVTSAAAAENRTGLLLCVCADSAARVLLFQLSAELGLQRQVYRGIEEMAGGHDLVALGGGGPLPRCLVAAAVGAGRAAAAAASAAAVAAAHAQSDLDLAYEARRRGAPSPPGTATGAGEFWMAVQTAGRAARVRVAWERDGRRVDEWVKRHVVDKRRPVRARAFVRVRARAEMVVKVCACARVPVYVSESACVCVFLCPCCVLLRAQLTANTQGACTREHSFVPIPAHSNLPTRTHMANPPIWTR